jgi:hypothetical protein
MTLYVPTNSVGGLTPAITEYLDLSQIASIVNRRFYRQGLNWAVAGIKVLNQVGFIGSITVAKLPNTWVMANAWEKGMRAWLKLSREAFQEAQSTPGRFLDFKIYADDSHHGQGFGNNLLPDSLTTTFDAGQWIPSEIVTAQPSGTPVNQTEYEIVAVGGNYPGLGASGRNAVSLIEGYANSRALPYAEDPNVPNDATDVAGVTPENWLSSMFDDGTQQTDIVITNEIQYDQPPYPFEGDGTNTDTMYPNGANQGTGLQIHDTSFITGTTIGGQTRLKGGNFPCGLIRFDITNSGETSNLILQIDLVPGQHRGYLCEPMTEM